MGTVAERNTTADWGIPVAHVDDPSSVATLLTDLRALHGPTYEFAVGRWGGETRLIAPPGAVLYRFLIETDDAGVQLQPGDLVRGAAPTIACEPHDSGLATATAEQRVELWPGDVVTANDRGVVTLFGSGRYFDVTVEATTYRAPRVALLRNLPDQPGGCAAYAGAFRRETIPPLRPVSGAPDQRGENRINEHTLDMRMDREPPPIRHYHGPIPVSPDDEVAHSEIAIVLSRSSYGLPPVGDGEHGHLIIYPQPALDPTDQVTIPVRPGSIVVTPATAARTMGHCFENCFAMLVAIPGFVAPYHMLEG